MTGDLAAAGDIATGGLIGRAVEPRAGEHMDAAHEGHVCPNCGTALVGEFCYHCGQPAHLHKTLMSIFHDVLHGVFHFDGKVWRTIPMLFSRPGALTRRYIAGERVRFVSPLALFLFSVFLMLATFETIGGPFGNFANAEHNGKVLTPAQVESQLAADKAKRDTLKTQRDTLRAKKADTGPINDQIDDLDKEISSLEAVRALKTGKLDAIASNVQIDTGSAVLDERVKHAIDQPELFLYKMQTSAYKFSWMLIPISLPFIWLLFAFRRDVGPYDHAIFAIYSLSAMTLGVVGLSILKALGVSNGIIGSVLVFGPPLHMYKQLRGAYRIGRFAAAWRTVALLFSATIATIIFLIGVLGLAAD